MAGDATKFGGLAYVDRSQAIRSQPMPWRESDKSTGSPGMQGFQGDQGNQGFQGVQGFQGFQGNQGVQGLTGDQGNQGNQGNQGFQGVQGNQGEQGDKGAILIGRTADEIFRVVCPECPETWLFDFVQSGNKVDPRFMAIIDPETLVAVGVGARIERGCVKGQNRYERIMVIGIRKGFENRRFVPQTKEQMDRSIKFWKPQFG